MNLDFLCIHPFRDGNGRVSRLLLLLQCYHLGLDVGRYVSLERVIEENKYRYYETLEQSSPDWHDAKHDPWPYINYVLFVLKTAYRESEARAGQVKSPRGAKTALIEAAIEAFPAEFTLGDLERACLGVSRDMIRRVLRDLQKAKRVVCLGRGPVPLGGKRAVPLKEGIIPAKRWRQ
jgi:Fic family protein